LIMVHWVLAGVVTFSGMNAYGFIFNFRGCQYFRCQAPWNVEVGMRNAEKALAECLIFIFSAFRIPNSTFNNHYGVDFAF